MRSKLPSLTYGTDDADQIQDRYDDQNYAVALSHYYTMLRNIARLRFVYSLGILRLILQHSCGNKNTVYHGEVLKPLPHIQYNFIIESEAMASGFYNSVKNVVKAVKANHKLCKIYSKNV